MDRHNLMPRCWTLLAYRAKLTIQTLAAFSCCRRRVIDMRLNQALRLYLTKTRAFVGCRLSEIPWLVRQLAVQAMNASNLAKQ